MSVAVACSNDGSSAGTAPGPAELGGAEGGQESSPDRGTSDLVGTSGGPDLTGRSITVYSGRNESLIGPLLDSFGEATGADVNVRFGNSTDLALLIEAEGASTPADVFISQSPGAIEYLGTRGLLDRLPDELIDLVPEAYRSDDGDWTGLSVRRRVLAYNTDLVSEEELPSSVFDLTDSKYAGRVGIAPANSSFQDFVTLMRTSVGDERTLEWLAGMAGNRSLVYATNSAIVDAVVRGEVDMGLVNHYYMLRYLDENPDASGANHYFSDEDYGSAVLVTGVGIVGKETSDSVVNQAFIRFLLSDAAQNYYFSQTREYPVKVGYTLPEGLLPLPSAGDALTVRFDKLADGLSGTQDLIERSGIH